MARKRTSRVWESVSKSLRSFRWEEKIILQFVDVTEQQFADDGGTTVSSFGL